MKKLFIVILIALMFCSCDYNIKKLPHKRVSYNELPDIVKSVLYDEAFTKPTFITVSDTTNIDDFLVDDLLLVNPKDINNYDLETIWSPIISSWVLYLKLIDRKKKICYKIPRETACPLLLYENKLYISNKYNYLLRDGIYEVMYTEYELK